MKGLCDDMLENLNWILQVDVSSTRAKEELDQICVFKSPLPRMSLTN